MSNAAPVRSATLGDASVREIPKLLTKEEIRELSRIDSFKYTAVALFEFSLIAAAVWISQTYWNPLVYVLAVIVIGSRINGLGALVHDAAHYRGYRNRRLNDVIGEIVALPTTVSMAGYRNTHFAHHRELNGENDPDWRHFSAQAEYRFPAARRVVLGRIAGYLSGLKAPSAVFGIHRDAEKRDIPASVTRARLAFFLALIAASIAFGFWKLLLLYWAVPMLTVFLGIRYIRTVAEHFEVAHESVLSESRTVLAPFWELWLIAPWGLNYHLDHHLYPSVPCFRLGELHRLLMTRDPYPKMAQLTHGYFGGLLHECAKGLNGGAVQAGDLG